MIHDSVAYLKSQGKEVVYDAEHFFDGYKKNPFMQKKPWRRMTAGRI